MTRYLILFCALLFIAAPARAEGTADPALVVKALTEYCAAPVEAKKDPAVFALGKNLMEFPSDQAIKFSPGGGRVFELPTLIGSAVLMINNDDSGACNIAVRQVQAIGLWKAIDSQFIAKSKFKLMREKRIDDDEVTKREYDADLNGPVTLLITAADGPRPSGVQALITIARVKK